MCVDCQAIKNIMVKYTHFIPSLDDMLDKLHGIFMRFMNHGLHVFIDKFVVVYFDYILV
jgi:hypothetical protein